MTTYLSVVGYGSALEGMRREENPYPVGTKEHEWWAEGWDVVARKQEVGTRTPGVWTKWTQKLAKEAPR